MLSPFVAFEQNHYGTLRCRREGHPTHHLNNWSEFPRPPLVESRDHARFLAHRGRECNVVFGKGRALPVFRRYKGKEPEPCGK